ncbi:MAG: thioredoxin domain-containing protein [Candidatus Heimdallarchaeota archaeon]|nr:thioredoxin domain-containing protein [Candidatus Heimdallarchaeota archaeon]
MVNLLGKESSPYLQQHKDNPVNWWPYSQEAFEEAKDLNRPIFISIGYSTCHWCHVMARESFEDETTAKFMNENFINIKIDREEHPDVDKAYQEMYQMLNRRGGGWPLSVFAHPDGSPFFIGTYFPKKASFGMVSFMNINQQIIKAWNEDKEAVEKQATNLIRGLKSLGEYMYRSKGELSEDIFTKELTSIRGRFDGKDGGIGTAPKFPRISVFRFLLQEGHTKNLTDLIGFTRFTYHKMAKGGLYDQLGGGFSRYSVDSQWLVPHFEKMLYDNAGLIQLGAELFAITKDSFANWVVKDTINWVEREMVSEQGGFYSALNAESEGREGTFFVWQFDEIRDLLEDKFDIAKLRYGLTQKGNFKDPHHPEIKGMNILSIVKNMQDIAQELKLDEDTIFSSLNNIRQILFENRFKRVAPSTDTKQITAWNSLMIKGLLVAAELLNYPKAGDLAIRALNFVLTNNLRADFVLRIYQGDEDFIKRDIEGVLPDYSFLIAALIQAFEYTDNWEYMRIADNIHSLMEIKFYDPEARIYFLNSPTEENILGRVVSISDDSMSSGLGAMVENLFKLGKYLMREDLVERGKKIAESFVERMNEFPGSMNTLLLSLTNYLRYPTELVIVNDEEGSLNRAHNSEYIPHRLVYRWNKGNKEDGRPFWDVLESRDDTSVPTVFICEGMSCSLPLLTTEAVIEELNRNQASE